MVELAPGVVPPSDQRAYGAGVRIEGDQCQLRLVGARRPHLLAPVPLLDLLVHFDHPCNRSLRRRALKVQIERRVDAILLGHQFIFRELGEQVFANQVHEIGRLAGFDVLLGQSERQGGRRLRHFRLERAGLHHALKNVVAALENALRVLVREIKVRPPDQPGEERCFRKRQATDVLVEISARRLAEPIDGKASALSEIDHVGVKLEDLLFGQPLLEQKGDENLFCLPSEGSPPIVQDDVPRQLHGERASALRALVGANVGDGRGKNSIDAHAKMREEAAVFGCDDGVHQLFWQVLIAQQAALGALAVEQRGHHFGLEPVALERHPPVEVGNGNHPPVAIFEFGGAFLL